MGIYINGMELPKDCEDCRFCIGLADTEFGTCAGCLIDNEYREASSKSGCPLIEIPEPYGEHLCEDEVVSCLEGADWINEVIRIFLDLQAEGSEDE